jgi:hypothetical protein
MKESKRVRALTFPSVFACLALAAAHAQKPKGVGETGGDGGRLYPVHVNNKWGYVDRTGKLVIEPKYDNEAFFGDGVAVVMSGLNVEAAMRTKPRGNTVVVLPGPEGIKWEIIDTSGKTLAELPRGNYRDSFFSDGLARIPGWEEGKGSVYGYMDKAGRVVIKPQFANAGLFREGLADACVESARCGFIDRAGKFVVPPLYKEVRPFSEDFASVVTQGDSVGFVNRSGEVAIVPQFSARSFFASGFNEGLAAVATTGSEKFGFIDKGGQYRIQPEFEAAGHFADGLARPYERPLGLYRPRGPVRHRAAVRARVLFQRRARPRQHVHRRRVSEP